MDDDFRTAVYNLVSEVAEQFEVVAATASADVDTESMAIRTALHELQGAFSVAFVKEYGDPHAPLVGLGPAVPVEEFIAQYAQ